MFDSCEVFHAQVIPFQLGKIGACCIHVGLDTQVHMLTCQDLLTINRWGEAGVQLGVIGKKMQSLSTPIKWSLNVWMAFLSMLWQWLSDSTNLYVSYDIDPYFNLVAFIASFIHAKHWLSRFWCLGTIPCHCIWFNVCVIAWMRDPSIWFSSGSIHDELLVAWWRIMMDLFPWLEMYKKSPVWTECIIVVNCCHGKVHRRTCKCIVFLNLDIDNRCVDKWPWVVVSFLIAFNHVSFEGILADACRYHIVWLMLGSSCMFLMCCFGVCCRPEFLVPCTR